MTTETTGAPEGVTEETSLVQQVEAAIAGDQAQPEQTEETEALADDAGAPEGETQAPKPRKTAQERIDELTAARREAEREAEFWRTKATQSPQPTPAQALAPQQDQEPHPDDYEYGETDVRFIRDSATFHATKAAEAAFARQTAEREAQQRTQSLEERFQTSVQKATAAHPDWQQVVGREGWPATPDMVTAIKESDVGGELAYHLASNPDEARRIAALSPHSQIRELGKIEARLATPPAPPPKTITNAPAPTPQVRGSGGQFQVAADTNDTAAFLAMAKAKLGT